MGLLLLTATVNGRESSLIRIMALPYYSLSVHQFVDFLLRQGDIDSRVYNQETMNEGTRLHALYQAEQDPSYFAEVPLSGHIETSIGTISLQGRADGLIKGGEYPIIDEIKSTVEDLETFFESQKQWHLGQALCYGYLYLKQVGGDKVGVRLTYISQKNAKEKMRKNFAFSFDEVEARMVELAEEYITYREEDEAHISNRDESVKKVNFPYSGFRKGQRELSKLTFGLIKNGGKLLFAEAPTGIGKTIATLFPAIKSFHKGRVDRIFYLTAKTTGGIAAFETLGKCYEAGFEGRDSFLVAKEKMCAKPGASCNPDECPFAFGYYTKLKRALQEAKAELRRYDYESVYSFCLDRYICPFEFQLDLSLSSDIIIADYNYFFDPMVHLERYFDETVDSSTFVTLIDEAHNLIKRGRDMYSVELSLEMASKAAKALPGDEYKGVRRAIGKIKKAILELEEGSNEIGEDLGKAIESFDRARQAKEKKDIKEAKTSSKPGEDYIDFAREITRYKKIKEEFFGTNYFVRIASLGKDKSLLLYCLDPSSYLSASLNKTRSNVIFSATLSPLPYFQESIVGDASYPSLLLSSPFPKENLKTLIAPYVSTRYKDRAKSYQKVAAYLQAFVNAKGGNYFLYFPSYEYLEAVLPLLDFKEANVYRQSKGMSEKDKREFLSFFPPSPKDTNIGLLVLGGVFSEGIDLVDDRLIGVGIVGVGLPQVNPDNEKIREYFQAKKGNGFAFAYLYPGMNKVFQAIGRLIRTPTDVGSVLLIDDRYLSGEYHDCLTRLYPDYEVVIDEGDIASSLLRFYKGKNSD